MRKTPPNNTSRSTETRFSPPVFPPKAGKADHIARVSKRTIRGLGNGMYALAQAVLLICGLQLGVLGILFLLTFPLDFEYDHNDERSNRNIILEDSTFVLVDENRTEIASADLLPGDWITFTHTGNITEIVHSSTSCSSSSSGSYYGESDQDSYYGGDDEMECWTDYYTHYVMNASSVMFESSSVNNIYMCHRSTCKVTGELVNVDAFLINIRSVEVIS